MSTDSDKTNLNGYLERRLSRSQLLKAAGVGVAAAAIPGAVRAQTTTTTATGTAGITMAGGTISVPFYPQVSGTYTPESIPTIINIAQTMEYLATTLVNGAVVNASTMGISGLTLGALQAALVEEVYHVQFLASMGATPMTTTFTVPDPAVLTNAAAFFRMLEVLEHLCNAAYMTANREFAELGQPLLAKFAYQAGSVEADHRTAARTALALLTATGTGTGTGTAAGAGAAAGSGAGAAGSSAGATGTGTGTGTGTTTGPAPWTGAPGTPAPVIAPPLPPNNKAFYTDYFLYMADAAALVKALGFIGGTGTIVAFPGVSTALTNAGPAAAAVLQPLPNNATTSATAADVVGALSAMGVSGIVAGNGTGK